MKVLLLKVLSFTKQGLWDAWEIIASISVLLTVWGSSMKDFMHNSNLCERIVITALALCALSFIVGLVSYCRYKKGITLMMRGNRVKICFGDIFKAEGYRVIGCDTKFSTEADDKVISKSSLHGKFLLNCADKDDVIRCIKEASPKTEGRHDFETGTVIRFSKAKDNHTYLLLALTKLNEANESHTDMAEFSQTMLRMWHGINHIYNGNDIVLPLLGTGITRFDDGSKNSMELLGCMLYTLYRSNLDFNRTITIVLWKGNADISLHKVKDIVKTIQA